MTLVPTRGRVLVKDIKKSNKTKGGLYLPETSSDETNLRKSIFATVVAVGDNPWIDGKEVSMQMKAGDVVIYNKRSAIEFDLNDAVHFILDYEQVLGVISKEPKSKE